MTLDYEKKTYYIKQRIEELQKLSDEKDFDMSEEIQNLRNKLEKYENEAYKSISAWEKVNLSRIAERPKALYYINKIFNDFMEFHGDRYFKDDLSIVGGIASFEGKPITVIGEQKGENTKENIIRNFGMPYPEGYRKAKRLMLQAHKFNRPIITFVDTPGAYCGVGAEKRGQGEAIAKNLLEFARLRVPVISIIIGEGGSGGALALSVANKVLMLENSIYAILSPEGFASILYKDVTLASKAAKDMKITAQDLLKLGIIDKIVEEPRGGAHKNPEIVVNKLRELIREMLNFYKDKSNEEIKNERFLKYRQF